MHIEGVVIMRYTFTGKDFTVSDGMKEKVIQKIDRLQRVLPKDCEVFVTISVVKLESKVEVTVPLKKRTLRAEDTGTDILNATDKIVDALERQMDKYKGQLGHKAKRDSAFKDEFRFMFEEQNGSENEEHKLVIKKSKKFALKPMDVEEAAMNMDLLGHSFFVFRNAETEEVNVVYKRNDNAYGLIEPEY